MASNLEKTKKGRGGGESPIALEWLKKEQSLKKNASEGGKNGRRGEEDEKEIRSTTRVRERKASPTVNIENGLQESYRGSQSRNSRKGAAPGS